MSKRLTFITLTIAGFAGLGIAIWQYRLYWEWLDTRGLNGAAFLELIFLGIFAIMIPLDFSSRWEKITPIEMVRDFFVRGILMMATVTGIIVIFVGIVFIGSIPARLGRPYLFIPMLILLVPLAISIIDIAQGTVRRSVANLVWGYVLHSFQIIYLLLVQFSTIPIAFVLFPAGFFLQLISIIDLIVRYFSSGTPDSLPVLCVWFKIGANACGPSLVGFHIGHLILAIIAAKYGEKVLDKAADGYAIGMEWLAARIIKK